MCGMHAESSPGITRVISWDDFRKKIMSKFNGLLTLPTYCIGVDYFMLNRPLVDRLKREEARTGREHVALTGKEGFTSVVEKKVNLTQPYAYIFGENVDKVLQEHQLKGTTFRVLFRILALVARGDVVAISQTGVAGDLGMSKQQVHKAWRELREASILLLDQSGHEYLNVNLFYRGSPKDLMAGEGGRRLEQSSEATAAQGVKNVVQK